LLTVALGAILFWTSQSVQDVERSLAKEKRAISREKETIRVLSTEWDYLNRPQRLERLAKEGIGMEEKSIEGQAIIRDVSSIPVPVVPVMPGVKPASLSRFAPRAFDEGVSESAVDIKGENKSFDALLDSISGDAQ